MSEPTCDARFWSKVERGPGCWTWTGGHGARGYGRYFFEGRMTQATHVALALSGQVVPPGMFVLHSCDNPPCVNPAHLRIGTHDENVADMHERGRARVTRGEANSHARLDAEKVQAIRDRAASGVLTKDIAAEFGIAKRTVRCIKSGERWAHV